MEEKNTTMGTTETMEDYKEALEASYRRIRPGDIVTGTVIDVNDQDVTIDFNYYAPGRIPVTELSDDPTYHVLENVAVGDTLTATVVKTDDGAGNMLLSCKDAAEELAWDKLQEAQKTKKVYHVKVAGAVNGGCVAYVEGVRGFIPASKLALEYVEEPADYLNKELDVQVISVDEGAKRVVLSAKELLLAKVMEEKNKKIRGEVMLLGIYDYTVVLTYISLGISVFGITRALEGNFRVAIFCLALSGLCDMFDGKIARTKKNRTDDEKNFGIQIDSLCDVVCFGIFPAMICYCLGVNTPGGIAALIFYSVASVIRLAYFNVTETKRQNETSENRLYYQGLPITSMAIILPFLYLMRRYCGLYFLIVIHIAVIIVGLLFILDIKVKKPQNPVRILLVAVVALALAKMFRLI